MSGICAAKPDMTFFEGHPTLFLQHAQLVRPGGPKLRCCRDLFYRWPGNLQRFRWRLRPVASEEPPAFPLEVEALGL